MIQYFNVDLDIKVIKKLLEEYTKHFEVKSKGADSIDSILDRLTSIISSVGGEFENFTAVNSDKKIFIRNLTKLILILVRGKYNTIEKN